MFTYNIYLTRNDTYKNIYVVIIQYKYYTQYNTYIQTCMLILCDHFELLFNICD